MEKKEFNQRVLEQQLFEELKDTSIKSCKYYRRKFEGSGVNISRLYRRIVNYQIKEYGSCLNSYVPSKNPEQLLKEHQRARQRRYERRSRRK